ncbi:MAG: dienelactone hydrolase family protein [Prevotellaceae bacterium]|jgi:dienelactone hydrolase|nr:dienelactone hydrolase family protein [Prevotellaceae bacterium]
MKSKNLFLLCAASWLAVTSAVAQDAVPSPSIQKGYELEREMPLFLDSLKKELTYPLAWGHSPVTEFDRWREMARTAVFDAMLTPPPPAADYDVRVVAEEQREGYRAQKVQFNLSGYSRVEAYLLVPDGPGPFPSVVLLHDHGGHYTIGKEKMIRPFGVSPEVLADADGWVRQCYGGQYVGDYLAAQGYAVISIDALFWGSRGRKEGKQPKDGSHYAEVAGNFYMLGRSLSGFMSYDDLYTVDFLSTLPFVDASRIGCMGFSMGAYRAWMLSALTDKIKAGVAICWMVTTDVQLSWQYGRERGGFANQLPGIRRYLDYPHIASIACPKPMFFLSGEHDKLFKPVGVREAFRQMHEVWKSRQADDRLRTELWDMPHDCGVKVQEAIASFLKQWL